MASNYPRKEVDKNMQECKQMDRGEMVRRRRRSTDTTKPKKYVFCSKWDPIGPNKLFYTWMEKIRRLSHKVLSLQDLEGRKILGR